MTTSLRVAVGSDRYVVVELQAGNAPVVLLAHGVGSSAMFLAEAFAAPLAAAGWRLAGMDLRGHGASSPAPDADDHFLATHAGDVAEVARVVGARVVGGVSIGAMAAVRAAPALDLDALVAVIPGWTGRAVVGRGPHAVVADEVRRVGVPGMLDRLEREPDLPDWIREVVLRDYRRHDPASLAAALLSLDGGDGPTLQELGDLAAPLAVVGWPDDPGHPLEVAQQWCRAAPRSQLVTTSIAAMQADRTSFGRAVVAALARLGVAPAA